MFVRLTSSDTTQRQRDSSLTANAEEETEGALALQFSDEATKTEGALALQLFETTEAEGALALQTSTVNINLDNTNKSFQLLDSLIKPSSLQIYDETTETERVLALRFSETTEAEGALALPTLTVTTNLDDTNKSSQLEPFFIGW
jgi:hypothetical protein